MRSGFFKENLYGETGTLVCEWSYITSISNKITSLQYTLILSSVWPCFCCTLKGFAGNKCWNLSCVCTHPRSGPLIQKLESSELLLKMCWCYCCGIVWHFSVIVRNSLTALSSCSAVPSPQCSTLIWLAGCYKVHSCLSFSSCGKRFFCWMTPQNNSFRSAQGLVGSEGRHGAEYSRLIVNYNIQNISTVLKFEVQTTVKCSFSFRFYKFLNSFSNKCCMLFCTFYWTVNNGKEMFDGFHNINQHCFQHW